MILEVMDAGVCLGLGREVGSRLLWFQESLPAATHHFDLKSEGGNRSIPDVHQMLELKGFLLPFVLVLQRLPTKPKN